MAPELRWDGIRRRLSGGHPAHIPSLVLAAICHSEPRLANAARRIASLVGPAWAEQRLELGWAVREAFRGQGHATEIGGAGLAFAFGILEAPSVIAFTERHNLASRRVMERLGMHLACEISARGLIEGKSGEHDHAPFAVYAVER